jgi:type IV pilus assembly protein PilC
MPIFTYTALAENGAVLTGEGVAATEEELTHELTNKGLLVRRVVRKGGGFEGLRRTRIRPDAFLLFNQELTALIRAGLTIPEALKLAIARPDNPMLAAVLQRVLDDVRGGKLFSEACAVHPEIFDGLYLSALKTGERTGGLVSVLTRYQAALKKRVEFDKKVGQALAYPLFLLATLVVILGVLFVFVMPRFVAMYADFGADLPLPTRILVGIIERLYIFLPIFALSATAAWLAWRRFVCTSRGRLWADTMKTRLPLLGEVHRYVGIAQLARTLATLLSGGTPLVEAMSTAHESLANRANAARLKEAIALVTEGKGLAQAMQAARLMPDTALKMIEVGEASGNLDGMLAEIAEYYEEIVSNKLARLMVLIEPIMMLLMGVLIGGIIVVMYLPIFHMVDIVK